ncbi:hypothetical protein Dsin_013663 [Dipteronia sinensis]|uniref:RNase H type-1 domain-containing protein n=1 Tax=Dipteronia sinensis TaxID=43782 RepID=A0AAE0AKW3_9ROSI|nr:hypothetical protein Dsin_013663 [Dipteronia sinensis]
MSVAILRGIQLALDTGFWQCTVESDAQVVVNLINSKSCVNSDVGLIITDILCLLGNLLDCSVRFTPRIANRAAHSLAKLGLVYESDAFWMEEVPPCVASIVLGDYPNFL